jgi:hypothetical protein
MCILLLLMGVHGFTKADRMGMRRGERGDHVIVSLGSRKVLGENIQPTTLERTDFYGWDLT